MKLCGYVGDVLLNTTLDNEIFAKKLFLFIVLTYCLKRRYEGPCQNVACMELFPILRIFPCNFTSLIVFCSVDRVLPTISPISPISSYSFSLAVQLYNKFLCRNICLCSFQSLHTICYVLINRVK